VRGVSDNRIARYPGDFAQALVALDALEEIVGPRATGSSRSKRYTGNQATHIKTTMQPGELIVGFLILAPRHGPAARFI